MALTFWRVNYQPYIPNLNTPHQSIKLEKETEETLNNINIPVFNK